MVQLIQYLPLTRPRATLKFLKSLNTRGINCILDLEDSAQDAFDVDKTNILKHEARVWLGYILERLESNISIEVYIRINSSTSRYYEEDLNYIQNAIPSDSIVKGIFLPKVESYKQIEDLSFRISQFNNASLEIVPMIETKSGLANLTKILDSDENNKLFDFVHYGQFDYCLSAGIWPFSTPRDVEFWDIIKYILSELNNHSKSFVHTPFPFPEDKTLFWQSIFYLMDLFPKVDIMYSTLNIDLSLTLPEDNLGAINPTQCKLSTKELISQAELICREFLENRANKRSFAISNGCFIPPHQYIAAKEYLSKHK